MFSWAERRSDNFQDQWEREEKGYFQDQCQMVMMFKRKVLRSDCILLLKTVKNGTKQVSPTQHKSY